MIPARVSDLEKIRVLGQCTPPCPERLWALVNNEFGPARVLGGWVFRDGPYRRLDDNAKWKATYYDQEMPTDHTGEPFSWVTCPYCGRDLPEPPDDEGLECDDGC